jgi:hypothetical protein
VAVTQEKLQIKLENAINKNDVLALISCIEQGADVHFKRGENLYYACACDSYEIVAALFLLDINWIECYLADVEDEVNFFLPDYLSHAKLLGKYR